MVMGQIVKLLVDYDQNPIYASLLIAKLETLAPFLVISNIPTHQTSTLTWEKLVILDQIYEIWIFPFVFDVVVVTSLVILLLVTDQYCLSLQYPLV
jgi:phosphatidylserine synthase